MTYLIKKISFLLIVLAGFFFGQTVAAQNKVINVNMYDNNDPYNNTQWNNQLITQVYPYTSGTYNYSDGSASTIFSTISASQAFADNGAGYPTTMCPSQVGRYASYFSTIRTITFKGLNNAKFYDLQLYCSRSTAQGITRNTINGVIINVPVFNNFTNIAAYSNIAPSNGQIVLTQTVVNSYVYLNGFTITEKASATNQSPAANAGANQAIQLPVSTVTLNGSGTDADGTIASYAWSQVSGTAATITSASSASTTITGLTTAGVRVFRLTVTDNQGATGTSDVTITVNPANIAPAANAGANQTIQLPVSTVSLSGSGTDADGTIASYAWTQVSGTAATITSASSASTSITGLTTAGVRVFRLTVTDNQGATGTSDVTITVNPVNIAPAANAGTNQTIQLPVSTVTLNGSGTDADGTIASYAWTQVSGTAATITSASSASTTITGLTTAGVRVFRLTVADNQGATGTSDVTVTVNPANIAPTANAGTNQTIQLPVSTVSLSGSGTDADGTIASYAWSQVSGTAATITSASLASTTITGLTTSGVRVFRLTVTDNLGATGTSDVTVTVNPANIAPTANAGTNQSIQLPVSTVTLNGSGTDADGTIASYAWTQVSGAAATITSASSASTTITGLTTAGVRVFRLTVTDNLGATGTSDVTITVNPANIAPAANAGANQTIQLPTSSVSLSGSGTDADGTIASYAWTQVSGTAATITSASSASTTITGLTTAGARVFRLTVTDNQGATGTSDVTVTVNPANIAPAANAGANQSIQLPVSTVTLNGSGTDADGTIASYAWSQVSGTAATITSASSASTTITDLTTSGVRVFRLTVTDNQGATGISDVTITVNPVGNQLPAANAGSNQTIQLPVSSVSLSGSGTDPDGTIASYAWTQVSGTAATITSASSASTTITGLTTSGVRVFRLTVTDNLGATGTSDVTITVNPANIAPTANAGTNQMIQLPVSGVSLSGSGTDPDGTIASYAWTQVSGAAATITSASSASTTITGLTTAGARVFRLTVTDNQGATGTSDVTITVNPANIAPAANAGTNQTIQLPVSSVTLNGSGTDADGTIASYAWSQVSGTAATITSASSASTTITGLTTAGVRVFRLTVTDNQGATGTSDVTITVNPANIPPTANAGTNQTIQLPVSSVSLSGSGTDPDGTIASYAWTQVSGTAATITSASSASTTVTGLTTAGVRVFRLTVTDNQGATGTSNVTVTVNPANIAPTANAGTNQTIQLPVSTVTLNGSGTDADGTIASYAWSQVSGTAATITSASSASTTITGLTTTGARVFRLTVTDNQGATGTSDVTITVNPANIAPTANAGTNQTIQLPVSTVTLNGSGTDADGTIASYAWSQVSGTAATITSASSASTTITGLTTTGVRVFRLTVTDNLGATATSDVTITVNPANIAPAANAGANQTIQLPVSTVSLSGSGTDADGTIASYAWTQVSGTAATITTASSASTTITGLTTAGVRVFRLTVTDNQGATGTSDVTITVNPANIAPTANAGTSQTIQLPVSSVTLNGSGTDADGTIASYAWTQVSGTAATITSASSASTTITGLTTAGARVFRLTVTDNQGATGTSNVTVTVNPANITPTANAGINQTIQLPVSSVSLSGSGTDPDGTIASYAWTQVSGTAATITTASSASTTITGLTTAGVRVFRLTVTDNQGATATSDVTVTVNPANIAPTANAGTSQTITLPTSTVSLSGSGSDADGTIAAYAWSQVSGTAATITSASSASTMITGLTTAGVRVFRLTVTDNQGATGTSNITITVNPGNIAPTANAGTNQTITLPATTVSLSGSGSDADGTIASYAWTQVSGTAATITSPSSAATTITGLTTAGVRIFRLTVTDNQGSTGIGDVTVTVNAAVQQSSSLINVNIYGGTNPYSNTQWNNWNAASALSFNNLNYSNGTASVIDAVLSSSTGIIDNATGWPVTMCPQEVGRYGSYGSGASRTLTLSSLNNSKLYKIELYSTRNNTGQSTGFTVNGTTVNIATSQNLASIATFNNIAPVSGNIVITITRINSFEYLNGFVITEITNNQPPTANAGVYQTIQLPVSTVSLSGSGTDADGTIASYAWSQVSGTAATITSASSASTTITGLTTAGVRVFRLTVTDNLGGTGTSDVTVTVKPVNVAPIATAGTNQTITLPTSTASLTGSGTDADGSIASYLWSQISGTAATITSPSTPSTTITGLSTVGVRVFRLTVTDNQGATGTSDITITINPVPNQLPVANAGANQTIQLPVSSVSLSGSGTDADGTIASYAWSQVSGTAATITSPSSAATTITGLTTAGTRVFRLTVTDNLGATGTSNITITVNPANVPPTANAGSNQTINLPLTSVSLSGSGTDADGTIASYAWTQVSGTAATITNPSSASTTVTGLTTIGVRVFRLTVTDNQGATGTSDVTITVIPVNIPPTANAGSNQTIQLPISTVSLSGTGTDADGTIASYVWSQVSGTAATITPPSSASTTITGLTTAGVRIFRLSVTDNSGATVTSDVTITVIPANITPTASAGTNQTIQLPVSTVTLSGSGTDADGTIASYAWTQVSGITATITNASSASTTITGLATAGVRIFRLTVTDNQGATGTSDVTITVNPPNVAPTANAGANQVIALPVSIVTLSGTGTDPDGTIASFAWTQLSGTAAIITNPLSASTTVTGLALGVRVFRLTVTDNQGLTGTSDVTITVNPFNQVPVANAGNNQIFNLPITSTTLTGSGSDIDGTIASYAWTQVSGTAATISSPSSATTNITGMTTAGVRVFRLTVTDNAGGTGTSDITITVNTGSILDPNDPVITYNSASPPTVPAGGVIAKWVRKVRLTWNTDSWKPYFIDNIAFRLKYPKSYNPAVNDGKRYPMIVFFHGLGEVGMSGINYDNEYSLANGGPVFTNAVDNGSFDGYILIPQSPPGGWASSHFDAVSQIADYMVANNKLDPFAISVNGLSAGGYASWGFVEKYPNYCAASLPMSGVTVYEMDPVNLAKYKFTPIWLFQGGLDHAPDPYTARLVVDSVNAVGGTIRYTLYPNLGHGTWSTAWAEPDFFPFINRAYSANPWALYGRTEFCPADPINVTIGVGSGFNAYEWRRNGAIIPGAIANTIQATLPGIYDVRILKGSVWSQWSHTPIEIKIKAATVTPPITTLGLMSRVIPALDTNKVTLKVPAGYVSYTWQKAGDPTTVSTDSTLSVATPGDYIVKVTEQYGCSSSFGAPFTVIDANGINKPSPATNLTVSVVSKSILRLDWSQNPSPQYNETNFEIYQATKSGGPYKLSVITAADASTANVTGLNPKTTYYFKVRAINNSSASAASNEASGITPEDTQAPTAPGNLAITSTTRSSISLSWVASTDDAAVTQYYVYINGVQSYTTTQTVFTVNALTFGQSYNFSIRARDFANNLSPFSNQVTGQPLSSGLNYKQYTFIGSWTNLPDFNTLTPAATGTMPNIAITPRTQNDNFAFLWEGSINVTAAGTYFFRTNSDDGSKLYLGSLNGTTSPYSFGATALVSNDGQHSAQDATSASITLAVGVYPIAVTYFDQTGGESMTVSWRTPSSGTSYVVIPNSAFADAPVVNGQPPAAPSYLVATAASYKKINLSWVDNSNNETGFEIWRSTNSSTGFTTVGLAAANTTSFSDSILLNGNTSYYYQLRAIGQYGESPFVSNLNFTEALWKFNNNYADSSGNGLTLTATASPVFDAANKKEGSHSVTLNGTTQYTTMPTTGSFLQTSYTQKTIAFWMRSVDNTGNRVVVDIGGSDNGIAVLLNSSTLIAAVANNNVRTSISAAYTSTAWNHIAVVYSTNSVRLYVNGVQAVANTSLSFSSIGATTNGSRIGTVNGTNAFNAGTAFFSGGIDNFGIYNKALSAADITNLMNNLPAGQSFATTLALPATPAMPSSLLASATSTSKINVAWIDNSNNESNFELYRSNNNNSNYLLLSTLAPNTVSYIDSGLFTNAIYYYKVRAAGIGSNSAYSNEDSAITKNNIPVVTAISNQSMHYQSTLVLNIQATDSDAEFLTLTFPNLPAFASFQQTASGTGQITFTPNGTQGVFNNIIARVTDQHGGTSSVTFNLTVNTNFKPVIAAIANLTINENDNVSIPLTATDQNATDVLTWAVSGLPSTFALTPGANGAATLQLQPNFAAAGVYTVQVSVSDGNGGTGAIQFTLTVNDRNPNTRIYTRIKAVNDMGTPWNNITGITTPNLNDEYNNPTTVGLNFLQSFWLPFNGGPLTGNNSGVYPDVVLNEFWYFGYNGGPQTAGVAVTGLNPAKKYNLTFYAGSAFNGVPDNGTTTYTVGAQTVSLSVQNNTQNTVSINNITPAADGSITVNMAKAANTPIGYLNALVITAIYNDGTTPVAPTQLTAQNVSGQGVKLTWQDVAYNETGYEVYRSLSAAGTFTLVGSTLADAVTYTDGTVSASTQYFYKVRAINSAGASGYSNVVSITTINRIPQINPISDVTIKNNQTLAVNVTATDDATDHIRLTASGLPSFATFVDNGNGTGVVNIQPTAGSLGVFPGVTITAKDNSDSSRSVSFSIYVTDVNISSTYVNITDLNNTAPAPWNNMSINYLPLAGSAISNLKDDGNINTGISVTLTDAWQGVSSSGMRRRNGSELYPEPVSRAGIYFTDNTTHRITVTGLNPAKKYNFVFYSSHSTSESTLTNFAIGTQTVSLNGCHNSNKTVEINGIVPAANGQLTINVTKNASATSGLLSALVIQSYTPGVVSTFGPADLRVLDYSATNTVSLQWQDRADNETGYEVWRANDGGTYSLLTTLAANSTSYVNTGLASNTTYNYIVRAKNGTAFSSYSNAVKGYTYASTVFINVNTNNVAGSPWNNLNWTYQVGAVWNNFRNEAGIPTNMGMVQPVKIDGMVTPGVNTGNNSGVFPDNVLAEAFGMFPGLSTYIKLTGMNISKVYDITLTASITGVYGDNTTAYTINGKTCLLNSIMNKDGTLTVFGIVPDQNGEVTISFTSLPETTFSLLGALVIKAHDLSVVAPPVVPGSAVGGMNSPVTEVILQQTPVAAQDSATTTGQALPQVQQVQVTQESGIITAYPNPFHQDITLSVPVADKENIRVQMSDVTGRVVYEKEYKNLVQGNNIIRIEAGKNVPPGMYLVRVIYLNKGDQKTIKMIKR